MLMPVTISPRSARDSLRVPCLQLSGPHKKNARLVNTGGCLETGGGGCLSRLRPQQPPRTRAATLQVQRSRQKDPSRKNWLGQLGQVAPVVAKGSFSLGDGRSLWRLSASLHLVLSPPQPSGCDPVPSAGGVFVPSWLDCRVGALCLLRYLGNPIRLELFSPQQ